MDDQPALNIVERHIHISAQPETVFPYLTDLDRVVLWMGSTAILDPKPGGIYQVRISAQDVMRGNFLEVDPPNRVSFTFGWEGEGSPVPPGSTTVEITLEAVEGGTLVRLRHSDLPEGQVEQHAMGWEHYFGRLQTVLQGGDPGPDPFAQPGGMEVSPPEG